MAHVLHKNRLQKILASLALCVGLSAAHTGHAGLVNLTQVPLTTATPTVVLPNIMFTLDDSGSMDWDFMPDWVGDVYSRASQPDLYRNSAWNVIYYDPAVTYAPPVHFNADGSLNTTTYPSQGSPWTSVKYDAFGVRHYSHNVSSRPDQLCPNGTVPSGTSTSNYACDLSGGKAHYYTFVAGEYCAEPNLKTCITASAAPAIVPPATTSSHPYPALLRWCNNASLLTTGNLSPGVPNSCQSLRTGTFTYKRHPGGGSSATLTVAGAAVNTAVSSIKVNGLEILNGTTNDNTNSNTVASRIAAGINACTAAAVGNCTIAGYSATVSGSVVTIVAPSVITFTPVVTIGWGSKTVTATAFNSVPGSVVYTQIGPSTTSTYPYPGTTIKHKNRTDCAASAPCTYTEEMTNYANWFTYYHIRTTMMKSAVSRAFKAIDNKYRVGFNLINYIDATDSAHFLHIDKFELAHKNSWYSKLFASNLNGSTPLQGALGKVGRLFANKVTGQVDPMQYSCQQNFSILSTDGYWNSSSNNYSLANGSVGNMDAEALRPMKEGTTPTSDTLADIAKYYYETDLRTVALGNCTSGVTGNILCAPPLPGETIDRNNNVFVSATDKNTQQHMVSFTIGLADGTLVYQDDYLTANSGDFARLKNGAIEWPNPIAYTEGERIDDLWHAAVNGRGEYYNAHNPDQIVKGLTRALSSIGAKLGAGAAAATSTLNPVASDRNAYVASYTTVSWRGNLESRLIDLATGATSETATVCVEDVQATCEPPGVTENDSSGASIVPYCVTPNQNTCTGGTLDGPAPANCRVPIAALCTGTLKSTVAAVVQPQAYGDGRTIYMKNAAGNGLTPFTYANMTASQKAYFSLPTALSQWPALTPDQQTLAVGDNLVKFLRGQTRYEDRTANTEKLYRMREATLGDAVESQPIFIGKPTFSYTDSGYDAFKTAQAGRAKTIFLGANDGMLHAFNAETLEERWAYVPSMVMPNMWKLADKNYATLHNYFVNGPAVTSDVYYGGTWRSILVGSLHGGGRGFYALDVTDPTTPLFLWEFTYTQTTDHTLIMDDDLGYSFAEPKIGKLPKVAPAVNGEWKVFLPSGYNNVSPGDGTGHVYVLDPITGHVDAKIDVDTTVGSTTTPSGLAKIEFYTEASEMDNTALFIYGGDLLGNVWRIKPQDNNLGTSGGAIVYSKLKLAVLKDASGGVQPITTRPELAKISDKRVVYIATGKYLEQSDLTIDTDDSHHQSLYAIKDDDATAPLLNARTGTGVDQLVQQTWSTTLSNRTSTSNAVNFVSQRGWYVDFPDDGERANVDPRLEFGTLLVPTTIPSIGVCSPGGTGWINFVNYSSGGSASGLPGGNIAYSTNTPVVGVNVISLPDGSIKVSTVEAGDPTPRVVPDVPFNTKAGGFQGKRVIWRELVQ